MWSKLRYTSGSQPGKAQLVKKMPSEEEKLAHRQKYETDVRKRHLMQAWTSGRPWLQYSSTKNEMTCTICIEYVKTSKLTEFENLKHKYQFLAGCSNMKISAVQNHEQSKLHLTSTSAKLASETTDTPARKALASLNESQREDLETKFRNAHAIAKNNRPISDYIWLCELDRANNILALVDLIHSLPPTTVLNETSFNQMKLIKTSRQHRMAGPTLNDCMVVRLESASVREFDPSPAVTRWLVSLLNYKISPRPNTVIQNQIHLIHY